MASAREKLQEDRGPIGPAGCGLGHLVFGGEHYQVLASIVNNAISTNQIFGISSGTLDCGDYSRDYAIEIFVERNRVALETETARGSGETLTVLATIAGCDGQNRAEFADVLRRRHSRLFPASEAAPSEIANEIRSAIAESPNLQKSCRPWS